MINVIGLGYIGLPTALMLAKSKDNSVIGTDYNEEIVQSLKHQTLTFEEEGLDELLDVAVKNGIEFTSEYKQAEIYIVSVPTPYIKASKKLDPSYVVRAVESILEVCSNGAIIVIESTIAPGTIDKYIKPIVEKFGFTVNEDIHLAHAPERIIPGNMVEELTNNSRTIGVESENVGLILKKLYKTFCKGNIVITDIKSAEMSKVVENTYRDINIAFANELALICENDGLDVYEIIKIANMHPRVNILQPGPGVGGHCISVDPWFLVGDYPELTHLIKQARDINDYMPEHIFNKIKCIMDENNINDFSKVGIYGITYKENVDDVRESPTLQMFEKISNLSASKEMIVYDPFIDDKLFEGQVFDFETFVNKTDLVVIMVNHNQIIYKMDHLKEKIIFDTKNCSNIEGTYKL